MTTRDDLTDICFYMGKLAHEINNRLHAIVMTVDNALSTEELAHKDSHDCLQTIKEQSFIVSHIVEAIQVLTSISAEKPNPVDVNQLVTQSVELVKFMHPTKCDTFVTKLTRNRPVILVDKVYMDKCFLILLENALFSTPKNGQIKIITTEQENDSQVCISISYNSPNALQSQMKSILSPTLFIKDEDKLALQLGFGLIRRIITLFNGTIEVKRCESSGTTITISLPTHALHSNSSDTDYMSEVSSIDHSVGFSSQSREPC